MFPCKTRSLSRLFIATFALVALAGGADNTNLLTVLHTNDIMSHFDENKVAFPNAFGAAYFGGVPRLIHKVKQQRLQHDNVLTLDAGGLLNTALLDNPSGKSLVSDLVSLVGYDAMAIGWPEMQGGVNKLIEYMTLLPDNRFICTDIDIVVNGSVTDLCKRSLVVNVGKMKVGIVSAIDWDSTPEYVPEMPVKYQPERIKLELQNLRINKGVRFVIGLLYMAPEVKADVKKFSGLDLVVLSYSKGFFYNGQPPNGEDVFHPYPIKLDLNGRQVLVVSAYTGLVYVGFIQLLLDPTDDVSKIRAGNPVMLTGLKDFAAEAVMQRLRPYQHQFLGGVVGSTDFHLDGSRRCRTGECSLGSLVADAMLETVLEPGYLHDAVISWSQVSCAIFSGANILSGIERGVIYAEYVRAAMPFQSSLAVMSVTGDVLLTVLQEAAYNNELSGHMFQVAGLRILLDKNAPAGQQIQSVSIICSVCHVPAFLPIDLVHTYRMVVIDRHPEDHASLDMFYKHKTSKRKINVTALEATIAYIRRFSPLARGLDGRIDVITQKKLTKSAASQSYLICRDYLTTAAGFVTLLVAAYR